MEPKLNCGKVTFKGTDFNVYRNPELLFVWISEGNRTPFTFTTKIKDYKATNDEEARNQAMQMLNEFQDLFVN